MARVVVCKVVWRALIGKPAVCCLLGLGEVVVDGNWCVRASGGEGQRWADSWRRGRCSTDDRVLHGGEEVFRYACISRARMTQGMLVSSNRSLKPGAWQGTSFHCAPATSPPTAPPFQTIHYHRTARASQTREPSL